MGTIVVNEGLKRKTIDVKSIPEEKIDELQNSNLRKIALSVGKSNHYGIAHQNHGGSGGGGGGYTRKG